ncbi:F-box protein PP2-B1 [Trifolium medium]|uniref:F-box protein PP2-B1 n=1 Tax=Trifolium medium TaxID=97028 RepID=A0A392MTE1_9FABA|nr:F-box protein PP2-B1 [Trifolium medium]
MQSFQLERNSGKKCYMLSARSLAIVWGDDTHYWNWIAMPDSRFPEVAFLRFVWWLEIRGMINKLALSKNTRYAAYLVFKMQCGLGFENTPVELSVGVEGGLQSTKNVCLYPNGEFKVYIRRSLRSLPRPSVRSDGWLEIEMGEFFNSELEDEEIHMSVIEIKSGTMKERFSLEGIEVRPKVDN